jgi:hypothetical protein
MRTTCPLVCAICVTALWRTSDAEPQSISPRPDGVAIVDQGDHVLVVDTIGGFQMELPKAPQVKDTDADSVDGTVHLVNIGAGVGDSALALVIRRLPAPPRSLDAVYSEALIGIRNQGYRIAEDEDTLFAGRAAHSILAEGTVQGHPLDMHVLLVPIPGRNTVYFIGVVSDAGHAMDQQMPRWLDTFQRTP